MFRGNQKSGSNGCLLYNQKQKHKQHHNSSSDIHLTKKVREKSLIEMVLVVPKAFILNSLLDSKLSDSLFIINSIIMYVISINVKKYQKIPKMGVGLL